LAFKPTNNFINNDKYLDFILNINSFAGYFQNYDEKEFNSNFQFIEFNPSNLSVQIKVKKDSKDPNDDGLSNISIKIPSKNN